MVNFRLKQGHTRAVADCRRQEQFCQVGPAASLPWPDAHFDLVISINTLQNLYN